VSIPRAPCKNVCSCNEFPHITVEKVEDLTNLGRSRRDGVRAIPTLVSGGRQLSGFYLTRNRLRRFLESL
jgi:hypothetical protein